LRIAGPQRPHVVTEWLKNRGRLHAAATGEAVAVDDFVFRQNLGVCLQGSPLFQHAQRQEARSGEVTRLPFLWLAHIEHHSLLLGQSLPADLPAGRSLLEQDLLPALPAGVPADVLTRRPDVRQAEQQLIANNANIGAARAAFFPRITLTGSAGVVSGDLDTLFNSGTSAWTFAPQLLLPIFDAGRNQANLESAKVSRDIAVAQYEKAIQSAFREVADALAGRATLGEQVRAQSAQLAAEKVRTQLTELRFKQGAASALDLLDAQRSLFAVQQATVQAHALQQQNLVSLYKVLGGGWK